MRKAIKISLENQSALASQYRVLDDDFDDMLPVGYWLVASFASEDYDLLTQTEFNRLYTKFGDLENGYIDVVGP